jgi:hypothetical protein
MRCEIPILSFFIVLNSSFLPLSCSLVSFFFKAQFNITDTDAVAKPQRLWTMCADSDTVEQRAVDTAHIGKYKLVIAALDNRMTARRMAAVVLGKIKLGIMPLQRITPSDAAWQQAQGMLPGAPRRAHDEVGIRW